MNAKQIIEKNGGAVRLAEKLGFESFPGQRRINNWKVRGIPSVMLLKYPNIFKGYKFDILPALKAGVSRSKI